LATVIDSLVVMLGLDSKGLQQGASKAKGDLKSIEQAAGKTEKAVEGLGKGLLTLLSVIGGTVAIKAFVQDFIDTNAQLDRLSKNLDVGVASITQWGNAVEQVGGSSQGLQGTLTMLSKAQTQLRLTGESSLIPYFSMMGISMAGVGGKARTVTDELLDMASFAEGKDRPTMHNMFAMMGIDEGTINLLLTGRKELELTLARQKAYGDQLAKLTPAAARLQASIVGLKQQFSLFGLELLQQALPALEAMFAGLEKFGNWCRNNEEFIVDFLEVMTVGLIGLAIVTSPITLMTVAVLALGAAIALLWDDYQVWQNGGDSLIDWSKWEPGITAAKEGVAGLIDLFDQLMSKIHALAKLGGVLNDPNIAPIEKLGKIWDVIKRDEAEQFAPRDPLGVLDPRKPISANAGGQFKERAMDYFQKRGWSKEQAAGIVANLVAESGGKPNAVGDNGQAFGLAQWHPDRQAAFKKWSGKDIRESSVGEQLAFVQYELTQGSYKNAGDLLKKQTTAYGSGSTVSRAYERPQDAVGEANKRGTFAQTLNGIPGASSAAPAPGAGSTPQSVSNSRSVNIESITINTQATDAVGITQDLARELDYLFASQANYGMVP